jgi:hypothetical protein
VSPLVSCIVLIARITTVVACATRMLTCLVTKRNTTVVQHRSNCTLAAFALMASRLSFCSMHRQIILLRYSFSVQPPLEQRSVVICLTSIDLLIRTLASVSSRPSLGQRSSKPSERPSRPWLVTRLSVFILR